MLQKKTIAFPHVAQGIGGPGSFQTRLEKGLKERGWIVTYGSESYNPDIVLIIGGTKKLFWLFLCKLNNAKVVHRLDGLNWQHKVHWPGYAAWVKSEVREVLVRFIRRYCADSIVYQTNFISGWWLERYGKVDKNISIINNAVDLSEFSANATYDDICVHNEIVCVEGSVRGDPAYHILASIKSWSVSVYGKTTKKDRLSFKAQARDNVKFFGSIPRERVSEVLQNGMIFLNLEIIPPCPNAVIEAMSKGLPIVSYDTGSMRELVGKDAGILIPYKSDPWKLQTPDTENLEKAFKEIFSNYEFYSQNARNRAELLFNIEHMIDKYITVFNLVLMNKNN